MSVAGKPYKPGMGPDINQLSRIQHLAAVHDEIVFGGINAFLYLRRPGKDLLFLGGDHLQFV